MSSDANADAAHLDTATERLVIAIGNIAIADAWMYHRLLECWNSFQLPTVDEMSAPSGYEKLFQEVERLCRTTFEASRWAAATTTLLKEARAVHNRRNRYVHDVWALVMTRDGIGVRKTRISTRNNPQAYETEVVPLQHVEWLTNHIEDVSKRLELLSWSIRLVRSVEPDLGDSDGMLREIGTTYAEHLRNSGEDHWKVSVFETY